MGGRKRSRARDRRQATSALPTVPAIPSVLPRMYFGDAVPENEIYRTHYGKALDLFRIDYAIRQAEQGSMRELTDVGRETVSLDGHLSALLQKRLNRLAALEWDVQPAEGEGVDPGKAEEYARYVRSQLDQIPRFRDAITELAWAVFDARAASEIGWVRLGSDWAVTGLHWIHPRRISFGSCRDLRVVDPQQTVTQGFRDVGFPLQSSALPYKFITYTPRLFCDYPEREGLAPRILYWSRFARYGVSERNLLLELFGRPWRIVTATDTQAAAINTEAAQTAYQNAKNLSGSSVARMPAGFKLDIAQPFTGAGQVSESVIDDCRKVMSKLILGNTGTTDAVSTGLGSSIGDAHLSEEDLIIWSDARRLAETIEDALTDAIIAVNFGAPEVRHAPRFIFRTEPPVSRESEVTRIKGALDVGLRVSEKEAQEKLGVREVKPDEPYLVRVVRPAQLGQVPTPPAPEVVYPIGKAPPLGEVAAQPDAAINPPGGDGTNPPNATPPGGTLPPGTEPPLLPEGTATNVPDVDEPDAIAALCEKMNELGIDACEHGRKNACAWCGIERERDVELVDGVAQWVIRWKPMAKPSLQRSKEGWLRLLAKLRPELTPTDFEVLQLAPLTELRLMVGTAQHPP